MNHKPASGVGEPCEHIARSVALVMIIFALGLTFFHMFVPCARTIRIWVSLSQWTSTTHKTFGKGASTLSINWQGRSSKVIRGLSGAYWNPPCPLYTPFFKGGWGIGKGGDIAVHKDSEHPPYAIRTEGLSVQCTTAFSGAEKSRFF